MKTVQYQEMFAYLRDHQQAMVDLLTQIIEYESPSTDKPSLDRLAEFIAAELRSLGAQVEVLAQPEAGNHLCARWGEGDGGILLVGHIDTVWDLGTLEKMPVRIANGKLYGPGAEDMKGGIVVGLWALRALRELEIFPSTPITMLVNTDEETGSVTSRPFIEAEALRHKAVFVLEPALPPHGSLKTQRKGIGEFQVKVTGRASHAGADHARGINAIDELAAQILTIRSFTDYESGTTFNVGVVQGGTRSNVVPAEAMAVVDVRVTSLEGARRAEEKMHALKSSFPGTIIAVTGGFDRPPMERTGQIAALFKQAETLAQEMGFQITEAAAGGASDGNFTAALGVPTLDGMGVDGDGGHALDEHAIISSLPERAALLAAMLIST